MKHEIPFDWIVDAGLQFGKFPRSSFRCDTAHQLIAIADIEWPMRDEGVTLDQNGFNRERMISILHGIRDDDSIPPIYIEVGDLGQRPYRIRNGFHRYYASVALGFSHVPSRIVERLE